MRARLADENHGYTWEVTFLTELGSLDLLELDGADLTGTLASGTVMRLQAGQFPSFDSLDSASSLPLGFMDFAPGDELQATIGELEEEVPYYFRVSAHNAYGSSPYAYPPAWFATPHSLIPTAPTESTLEIIDGTSLNVQFNPPAEDGGQDVNFYRVEYAQSPFAAEVQQISAACNVINEIQAVSTSTGTGGTREVQLLYIATSYNGVRQSEIQQVMCRATGGTFTLSFNSYIHPTPLPWNANAAAIKAALQQITNVNTVTVSMNAGQTTACSTNPTGLSSPAS
eukprot:gene13272-15290_t